MLDLRLYLFGSPYFEYQGNVVEVERRKGLAIAAYLALSQRPLSRELLAALLWPDLDQEHTRGALRSTLPTITALSSQEWLYADRSTISLIPDTIWVDVNHFLELLMKSRSHSHGPESLCADCVSILEQAIGLYRDDFLANFMLPDNDEYGHWQLAQRERLRREFSGVLCRLSGYYGEQSSYDEAIAYARRWVAVDPLHERAQRMLIRLYASSGQRTEALRQYQFIEQLLDAELATPPEDETIRLFEIIKNGGISSVRMALSAKPVSSILPPMPTLIVGREEAFQDIEARLGIGGELRPMTVIQGWPGVGKSTTVAALAHSPNIIEAFPDGVLWASLGETPSLLTELLSWAEALKLVDRSKAVSLEELTSQATAVLRDKRMLLI